MEKRKLGEQLVITVDKQKHLMEEVEGWGNHIREVCIVNESGEVRRVFAKDLGILNEDGCLPSDFGVYPEVYEHVLMGINGYMVKAYISDPHVGKYAWGETKQQAIDVWNRRV